MVFRLFRQLRELYRLRKEVKAKEIEHLRNIAAREGELLRQLKMAFQSQQMIMENSALAHLELARVYLTIKNHQMQEFKSKTEKAHLEALTKLRRPAPAPGEDLPDRMLFGLTLADRANAPRARQLEEDFQKLLRRAMTSAEAASEAAEDVKAKAAAISAPDEAESRDAGRRL